MSIKDKLNQLRSVTTYRDGQGGSISVRAVFIEAGYNYLSQPQNETRAEKFATGLKSDLATQDIPVSSEEEFTELALAVLDEIADGFGLSRVDHKVILAKLPKQQGTAPG